MKQLKTALLASAFALATTVAFAQVGVGVGGSAGTSGGAAIGRQSSASDDAGSEPHADAVKTREEADLTSSGSIERTDRARADTPATNDAPGETSRTRAPP